MIGDSSPLFKNKKNFGLFGDKEGSPALLGTPLLTPTKTIRGADTYRYKLKPTARHQARLINPERHERPKEREAGFLEQFLEVLDILLVEGVKLGGKLLGSGPGLFIFDLGSL